MPEPQFHEANPLPPVSEKRELKKPSDGTFLLYPGRDEKRSEELFPGAGETGWWHRDRFRKYGCLNGYTGGSGELSGGYDGRSAIQPLAVWKRRH